MPSFANASRVGRGILGYSRQSGERKGPGGLPGLQHRCGAVRTVSGGFDSHALPPHSVGPARIDRSLWAGGVLTVLRYTEPSRSITASANSSVLAAPPWSGVRRSPAA